MLEERINHFDVWFEFYWNYIWFCIIFYLIYYSNIISSGNKNQAENVCKFCNETKYSKAKICKRKTNTSSAASITIDDSFKHMFCRSSISQYNLAKWKTETFYWQHFETNNYCKIIICHHDINNKDNNIINNTFDSLVSAVYHNHSSC